MCVRCWGYLLLSPPPQGVRVAPAEGSHACPSLLMFGAVARAPHQGCCVFYNQLLLSKLVSMLQESVFSSVLWLQKACREYTTQISAEWLSPFLSHIQVWAGREINSQPLAAPPSHQLCQCENTTGKDAQHYCSPNCKAPKRNVRKLSCERNSKLYRRTHTSCVPWDPRELWAGNWRLWNPHSPWMDPSLM